VIEVNVYQKLVEVRKVVTYIQKEKEGSQYKYVSSSQVLHAVRSKMDEVGLLLVPRVTGHVVSESVIEFKSNTGDVNKRTTTYFTELDMTLTWVNAEKPDETIECAWYAQGVDIAGEKGVGKALTYGEKTFLLKQFNIPTDTDDPDMLQPTPRNDQYSPPIGGKRAEDSSTSKEPSSSPSAASEVSEGQMKMLFAKASAAGLTDKDQLVQRVAAFLGYPVNSLDGVKRQDVTRLAQYLDKLKKAS
jgi:hypothetical protein